jgi:hypothetical protein
MSEQRREREHELGAMSPESVAVLKWWLLPLFIALFAGGAGKMQARAGRGIFYDATATLSDVQREELESVPVIAVANAIWAFGDAESVRVMSRFEMDRSNADETKRARALLRFGILDKNPDGRAAVFAAACAADPNLCDRDRMQEAAEREARARFVAPGNVLPLFLGGDHPPMSP